MKLQIISSGYTRFFMPNIGDIIDYYADLGYQGLDLGLDSSYDSKLFSDNWEMYAKYIKNKMKVRGMEFGQAHAPCLSYSYEISQKYTDLLTQSIKLCSYLDIKALVVHLMHVKDCDEKTFYEVNYNYFSQFLPLLDEYNVDLCFENLGTNIEKDMYCATADQLLTMISYFDSEHIHACWDTGHGNLTRQNQYDSIKKLGDHLKAIHVHDNLYPISYPDGLFTPDMHNFPLFGNINFDAVINALLEIHYKGNFSIETDTPNRRGHVDFIQNGSETLNLKPIPFRIRKMADEMLFEIGKYMLETYSLWEGK